MIKNKTSLIRKIISLLVIVLVITTIFTGILRYFDIRSSSIESATRATSQAASQVALMMDGDIVEECMINSDGEKAEKLKIQLRDICNRNDLIYLYICIPDFVNKTTTFVLATASEDADKSSINYENFAGKVMPVKDETLDVVQNTWNESGDSSIRIQNDYGDFVSSFALIKDDDTKIAVAGAGYDTKKIVEAALTELILKMLISFLVWISVFIIIGFYLKKKIVSPILCIANKMRLFTSDMQNNSFEPLDFRTGDEIEAVANSFNILSKELVSYVDEVKRFAAEEAKISTELDVARKIQYGIVSASTEKEISQTLHLSCRMNSARSVGGDFYDFFELSGGVHCLVIGDVSGKGIGAAMFMMLAKAILHEKLMHTENPADAVSEANDEICANNPENMFATVFVALIDEKKRELCYVNAGHNAPIIVNNSIAHELSVKSGLALGLFDKMDYSMQSIPFGDNDALIMFTDGVTECINETKEFFGTEKLINTIQNSFDTRSNYCDKILEEIEAFRKSAEQFDDITMVVAEKTK